MEVLIPPWVRPESPETIRIIDDATVAFQPAFGRGMTQRGIFADPRWGLRRRYRGLRSDEKAAILTALNESRGQLNTIRVTPHTPIRGSFATSELATNNTFASGLTGWTSGAEYSLSVSDRVMRARRNQSAGATAYVLQTSSAVTVVPYAPYVTRFMINQGRGAYPTGFIINDAGVTTGSTSSGFGLKRQVFVPLTTTLTPALRDADATGLISGDHLLIPYTSTARCALVDNAQNLQTRSDEFDNGVWTPVAASIVANGNTSPDGNVTADRLLETNANSGHYVISTAGIAVPAAVDDFSYTVAVLGINRTWCRIRLDESGSSSALAAYFNLLTGAVGTTTVGAGWSNIRTFADDLGGGWWALTIVGRKTSSGTTITPYVMAATADNVSSYTGTTSLIALAMWRATVAASAFPTRFSQTAAGVTTGTPQVGNTLYTKGWPASTNNLLITGDWFEINGELKQLTAPVSSDGGGRAYIQFRPGLAGSPAENDPIIVYEPFGRFLYPGTREFENLFGIYVDCEMNLEEVYS